VSPAAANAKARAEAMMLSYPRPVHPGEAAIANHLRRPFRSWDAFQLLVGIQSAGWQDLHPQRLWGAIARFRQKPAGPGVLHALSLSRHPVCGIEPQRVEALHQFPNIESVPAFEVLPAERVV
jgi:hypothetical protein